MFLALWVFVVLSVNPRWQESCFVVGNVPGIRLALPFKAVDLCVESPVLCRRLIADFPGKESAIGYYVTPQEWADYQTSKREFSWYFVAVHRRDLDARDIERTTKKLQQLDGGAPAFPGVTSRQSVLPLGILEQTSDSVAYGAVITMPHLDDRAARRATLLAAVHSLLVINERVVSLYSFALTQRPEPLDSLQDAAKVWLSCMRQVNGR